MALYGGVREGWGSVNGSRYNDTLFRGLGTFASAATLVITLPLPARFVSHALATLKDTTPAGTDIALVTVGNYSNNTFTIYAWKAANSSTTTLIAASGTWTVEWMAWGNCSGTGSAYEGY